MLDEAGFEDCKIIASNSLDEYIIRDLLYQNAKIDLFGVGERLITSKSNPVFDGVYKLCAVEDKDGNIIPRIKISENVGKITTPHFKKVYRFFSKENHKAEADLLSIYDEELNFNEPFELFDPLATWKRKTLTDYEVVDLLKPIFLNGELVYECPNIEEIKKYCKEQVDSLWDEVTRFENPHNYYVDLSEKLWKLKHEMINNRKNG
jgi:nicotinate phosphoribosyltransferase